MRTSLTIGGIEVELRAEAGVLERVLLSGYAPFLGRPSGDPACTARVESTGGNAGRGFGSGSMVMAVEGPESLDRALTKLFAGLALERGGVLLAASGVITGGEAHVFTGPPGSEKSTLVDLAGHRPVLADGYVLVRRIGDTWVAAGTPFGDAQAPHAPRQAPLQRIWSLRPSPVNDLASGDDAATAALVTGHAVVPHPSHRAALNGAASAIAASVPSAELRFTPERGVWSTVESSFVPALSGYGSRS